MYRILIVEDDAVIAAELTKSLCNWGFDACAATDFQNVLAEFSTYAPHLILMDISLPCFNGFYWCAEIRKVSRVPVVFLSSRAENMDIVMAMNMGGDDYLTKPVSVEVLVAKVNALLRRTYDYFTEQKATIHGAVLDAGALCLILGEKRIDLTRNELRILETLLAKKGEPVTREKLMLALWDSDSFIDDNTLTVNVNRLRKTLSEAGIENCIITHKNRGYALVD